MTSPFFDDDRLADDRLARSWTIVWHAAGRSSGTQL